MDEFLFTNADVGTGIEILVEAISCYTMGSINYHLHGPLPFHSMWIGLVIDTLMCVIGTSIGEVRVELVLMMMDNEVQWYSNWALDCHLYILYK